MLINDTCRLEGEAMKRIVVAVIGAMIIGTGFAGQSGAAHEKNKKTKIR